MTTDQMDEIDHAYLEWVTGHGKEIQAYPAQAFRAGWRAAQESMAPTAPTVPPDAIGRRDVMTFAEFMAQPMKRR